MTEVVLFDADGVLLKGEGFSERLERDYGITHATVQPFFLGPFREATLGTKDLKAILPPFLKQWQWPDSVEAFLGFWFDEAHIIDQALIGYAQRLRKENISCFVATNQEKYRARHLREAFGFNTLFDGMFISSELGVKKPDVSYFEAVKALLRDIPAERILLWDDIEENVAAARTAGLKAELYTEFTDFKQKMKHYV